MSAERGGGWSRLGHLADRHPLFAAAVVAVAAVVLADCHPAAGWAAAFGLALAGGWRAGWRHGLAWGVCGGLAVAVFVARKHARDEAQRLLLATPHGLVEGLVLEDARGSERYWSAPARLVTGGQPGTKVWWEGRGTMPVAGSVVAAKGRFEDLPQPRNPGEFDRASWLRRQGVAAMFRSDWQPGTTTTGRLASIGAGIRHGFRELVTAGLEPQSEAATVIRAVVIGEQPPDADALIAAFRNSGTLHVFSVSGMHVAMVGSIGWLLLGRLGVRRRWAAGILVPLIFGYAWITGNSAPAVRSAWMAALFLGAFVFQRKPDLLNSLGAVLLAAMLWDGRLVFQPGVQLSYGVVAAIAVGTAWAGRVFSWMAEPALHLPGPLMNRWQEAWLKLRQWTSQSLAVSLAAAVGSTPLTLFHFGLFTPVSVIAGLVLLPLVFFLLAAALLSAAIGPLAPPAGRAINRINGAAAGLCVRAAESFAAMPGGHFRLPRETRPMLLVYDLDYGAGAACFSGGREGAVLFDCGDRRGFRQKIVPSLRWFGIEPDAVALSHPDGHHLGGAAAVWQAFPIRQALLPVQAARSPAFRQWLNEAPAAGIRLRQAAAGMSLDLPDSASLEVIHAPDPTDRNVLADDRVAIYRLHWRGWRILFTSDTGMGTELRLLDAGKDVAAEVIIAGRHRGDLTLCDRFLDAVNPLAIIATNPPFPAAEKLPATAAAYWKSRGIVVIDQGTHGGVTLTHGDDGTLVLDGFLTGPAEVLAKPATASGTQRPK